jgi:ABC-type glycerol-3-phosphate transport system substrate-binding protein
MSSQLSRRRLLKLLGASASLSAAQLVAACSSTARQSFPTVVPTTQPTALPATAVPTAVPTVTAPVAAAPTTTTKKLIQIVSDSMPGLDDAAGQKMWQGLLADFATLRPDVEIVGVPGGYGGPDTFRSKVKAGKLETTFGLWFTEPQKFIKEGLLADVTEQLQTWPGLQEMRPEVLQIAQDAQGRLYGLPVDVYGITLNYNRALFTKAGLNPNQPPKTWAEVRAAAKTISEKLRIPGFGIAATNNQGGWQFTKMLYSYGVDPQQQVDGRWVARLNDLRAVEALDMLKAMRWVDNSLQDNPTFDQGALFNAYGREEVAMMLGGADVPTIVANNFKLDLANLGVSAMPQNGGNQTLGGGYLYAFNAKASPEQLQAAVDWVIFMRLNPRLLEADLQRRVAKGEYVGYPNFSLFKPGAVATEYEAVLAKYRNVSLDTYQPFLDTLDTIAVKAEPPIAVQEMYATLDTVVQTMLQDKNADPQQLLDQANATFQSILDANA